MGAALTYEVARPFKDEVGQLVMGEVPDAARVNGWRNREVLLSLGYLAVKSSAESVTGPAAKKLAVVSVPKAQVKAQPRISPATQMCPKCGKGPFKKLAWHIRAKHDKE